MPVSYVSLTPQPVADAFACSLRTVNDLGYAVIDASKEAGFVRAARQRRNLLSMLTRREDHDQLTVAIYDDAGSQQRKLRVTAGTTSATERTEPASQKPSAEVISDANSILAECAIGASKQQSH